MRATCCPQYTIRCAPAAGACEAARLLTPTAPRRLPQPRRRRVRSVEVSAAAAASLLALCYRGRPRGHRRLGPPRVRPTARVGCRPGGGVGAAKFENVPSVAGHFIAYPWLAPTALVQARAPAQARLGALDRHGGALQPLRAADNRRRRGQPRLPAVQLYLEGQAEGVARAQSLERQLLELAWCRARGRVEREGQGKAGKVEPDGRLERDAA